MALWPLLTLCFALLSLVLVLPLFGHAFRRSIGTGVMVLAVPGYVLLYAFRQYESPRRYLLVPALLGAWILTGMCAGLAWG